MPRPTHADARSVAYSSDSPTFDQFTRANANYYLYHGEISLLQANGDAIAQNIIDTEHAIIVGPGPATSFSLKEAPLLERLPHLKAVSLIDLSSAFNQQAVGVLNQNAEMGGTKPRHRIP